MSLLLGCTNSSICHAGTCLCNSDFRFPGFRLCRNFLVFSFVPSIAETTYDADYAFSLRASRELSTMDNISSFASGVFYPGALVLFLVIDVLENDRRIEDKLGS